ITCFANPTQNSYRRLRSGFQIAYSADRGSAMRIFGNDDIMLRTPDSTCNIFTVLALIFAAGREGIENNYTLRKEGEYTDCLFSSIDRSLDFAEKSEWLRKYIPGVFDDVLGSIKRRAVAEQALKTDWELFEFHADI
ncbi:MAG: glutamine synthetase, partial [Clostridiales bacterium]|nr:glutamine synthetase [Clostridiales bacterium]